MTTNKSELKICPICHKQYSGYPAISRLDNITPICSQCGTRQALISLNIPENEIDKILSYISDNNYNNNYQAKEV